MMDVIEFARSDRMLGIRDLSPAQETALRLLYGLALTKEQRQIARRALGADQNVPRREFGEGVFICGRRWGKSERLATVVALFEALTGGHEKHLATGERATVLLVAQDLRGVRVLFDYISGKLRASPVLSKTVVGSWSGSVELDNGLVISVFPPTFRAARGFSCPVAIVDEAAFLRDAGVNVDTEVVRAIRPAQLQFPRRKLILISTPYSRTGLVWEAFRDRHKRRDALVFQSPSWEGNPTLPAGELEREEAADPEAFRREYGAEFIDSLSSAFAGEAVQECVVPGRRELPPVRGVRYAGACDPAGGGADEFAVTICHKDGDRVVQDALRAWRAKRPEEAVQEAAGLFSAYGVRTVVGDRYAAGFVVDAFRRHGIEYRHSALSASEAFLEMLPVINQGAVELLDDKTQTAQLLALERRRGRAGKDSLGHPQGRHDDRANVLALAVHACRRRFRPFMVVSGRVMTAENYRKPAGDSVFRDSAARQREKWGEGSGWSRQEREALQRQNTREER